MPRYVSSATDLILALLRQDPELNGCGLNWSKYKDDMLIEALQALVFVPNVLKTMTFRGNSLTNKTGVKLGTYISKDHVIEQFDMAYTCISDETCHAIATALRINTSLTFLYLYKNHYNDTKRINLAFVQALRLNPCRPIESKWELLNDDDNVFPLFKSIAETSTPPVMLEFLLCVHLNTEKIETKKH